MGEESVRAEVLALNDDELLEKLIEQGELDAGPIMDSTRSAYQKMLIRKMMGKEYERVEADTGSEEEDEADNEEDDMELDDEEDEDDGVVEEVDSGMRQRYQERGSDMIDDPQPSRQVGRRRPNIFVTFIKMVMIGVFAVTLLVVITSSKQ